MRKFINLWQTQTVYGAMPIKWYRPMEFMDSLDTLVMFKITFNERIIGIHCFEQCDDLAYGHPPLYDKSIFPNLARFSWFSMIKYLWESPTKYLDLDGESGRNWRQLLIERHTHEIKDPNLLQLRYKWAYVSKDVKDNPLKEHPFVEFRCSCNWKQLIQSGDFFCHGHSRNDLVGSNDYPRTDRSPRFTLKF